MTFGKISFSFISTFQLAKFNSGSFILQHINPFELFYAKSSNFERKKKILTTSSLLLQIKKKKKVPFVLQRKTVFGFAKDDSFSKRKQKKK